MRLWLVNAVVGRIANFPIRGGVGRGHRSLRKGFVTVNYGCNITWGYVASPLICRQGGYLSNQVIGGGLARVSKIFSSFVEKA